MTARKLVALATGIGLISVLAVASPANAAPGGLPSTTTVVNKVAHKNYINKSQVLGECRTVTAGQTCSFANATSSTRTVQVALGVSKGFVTGSLNISSATTVSVTVSCTSGVMKAGQRYRAWPIGTRYDYRIKRAWNSVLFPNKPAEYSKVLHAFNPGKNRYACGVV